MLSNGLQRASDDSSCQIQLVVDGAQSEAHFFGDIACGLIFQFNFAVDYLALRRKFRDLTHEVPLKFAVMYFVLHQVRRQRHALLYGCLYILPAVIFPDGIHYKIACYDIQQTTGMAVDLNPVLKHFHEGFLRHILGTFSHRNAASEIIAQVIEVFFVKLLKADFIC